MAPGGNQTFDRLPTRTAAVGSGLQDARRHTAGTALGSVSNGFCQLNYGRASVSDHGRAASAPLADNEAPPCYRAPARASDESRLRALPTPDRRRQRSLDCRQRERQPPVPTDAGARAGADFRHGVPVPNRRFAPPMYRRPHRRSSRPAAAVQYRRGSDGEPRPIGLASLGAPRAQFSKDGTCHCPPPPPKSTQRMSSRCSGD